MSQGNDATLSTTKANAVALARMALRSFLDHGCRLDFRPAGPPQVSILLLLCNRAELTLGCFLSLAARLNQSSVEIVVVDNGSEDETKTLLERIGGLTLIRNSTNLGFPKAVNQAAHAASGKYLLLLNNDTQMLGRSIDAGVDFLEADADVGALGGKIIYLDGTLQEAGCTLYQDGWALPYGRNGLPDDHAYNFQRDVDYCSGAFLLTRRDLFREVGGLDEAYSPGYFEDPDYCIRLWQRGWRVVYCPEASILHFESATSTGLLNVNELMKRNHGVFTAKHANWLRSRPNSSWPHLLTRSAHTDRFNVLILAEAIVESRTVEEQVRVLRQIVARIEATGGFATLCLSETTAAHLGPAVKLLPRTMELLIVKQLDCNDERLAARAACYDLIVVGDAEQLPELPGRYLGKPALAVYRNGQFSLSSGLAGDDLPALKRSA